MCSRQTHWLSLPLLVGVCLLSATLRVAFAAPAAGASSRDGIAERLLATLEAHLPRDVHERPASPAWDSRVSVHEFARKRRELLAESAAIGVHGPVDAGTFAQQQEGFVDPFRAHKGAAFPELNCPHAECTAGLSYGPTRPAWESHAAFGSAKHVLIMGADGVGSTFISDQFGEAPTRPWTYLAHLVNGSTSYHMRSYLPTISKPNWCALTCGASAVATGATDNDWALGRGMEPVTGNMTYFPSVFQVLKAHEPHSHAAVGSAWLGLYDCFPLDLIQNAAYTPLPAVAVAQVFEYLLDSAVERGESLPRVMFTQFDDPDTIGHEFGYGSPEYHLALDSVDIGVGVLLGALKKHGILDDTLLIFASDHGGHLRNHDGPANRNVMYTPVMLTGPKVKRNFAMPCVTRGYPCSPADDADAATAKMRAGRQPEPSGRGLRLSDVPSTALFALGIPQPDNWEGRPILEAFQSE